MSATTKTNPLAVMDVVARGIHPTRHAPEFVALSEARAAVAELVEADREVDAIEAELRAAFYAGPRPNSAGTGWEARDKAAERDRERRHKAAHERRRAALAAFEVTP